MSAVDRPRVFLDIEVASNAVGKLVVELFTDKTPKTCENFRQLCTGEHEGLSYEGSTFHRIIDEFMIQGGDIANGDGTGIISIYGKEFEDENLAWRELDAANLVCSANRGKDTNGSQFFITLEAAPHLNGKHTVLGRLVSGEDTLRSMARVAVDDSDKPKEPVMIRRCGELQKRKKQTSKHSTDSRQSNEVLERGRIRKEHEESSHHNRRSDNHTIQEKQPTASKKRRPSDNVMDEGLRGRPRKRSRPRAESSAIDEQSQSDLSTSPVKIHKRGRSPSPSPAYTTEGDEADERRRRRSLPNQYPDRRSYRSRDDHRVAPHWRDSHRQNDHSSREEYSRGRLNDSRRNDHRSDHGRRMQSNADAHDGHGGGVKFKGRGVMKYREPDRL